MNRFDGPRVRMIVFSLLNHSLAIYQCETKNKISVDGPVVRQKSIKGGRLQRAGRCEKWQL